MKEQIHPTWFSDATVVCQCGNTWTTGATVEEIRTEICSNCHPFYTGEQRIVDTEGRVDKFMKRLQVRDQFRQQREAQEETVSSTISLAELGLNKRYVNALDSVDVISAQDVLDILEDAGDEGVLEINGIGQQALSEVKKLLRSNGFDVPVTEEDEA